MQSMQLKVGLWKKEFISNYLRLRFVTPNLKLMGSVQVKVQVNLRPDFNAMSLRLRSMQVKGGRMLARL